MIAVVIALIIGINSTVVIGVGVHSRLLGDIILC